jgi:hypothetical protein
MCGKGILNIVGSGGFKKIFFYFFFFLKKEKQIAICLAYFVCACIYKEQPRGGLVSCNEAKTRR